MHTKKLSISLANKQFEFAKKYQIAHNYKTFSEVIKEALLLLQQMQLEADYKEANQEIDEDFEATTSDGIEDDETW